MDVLDAANSVCQSSSNEGLAERVALFPGLGSDETAGDANDGCKEDARAGSDVRVGVKGWVQEGNDGVQRIVVAAKRC